MGLKGKLPIFISNFLSDREFNVRVNSTYSDIQEQEMRVPQGSILSATLFSIKINSLAKILNDNIEGYGVLFYYKSAFLEFLSWRI
jgi:hypothetical protein